jgi:hypothetical protein
MIFDGLFQSKIPKTIYPGSGRFFSGIPHPHLLDGAARKLC